MIRSSLFFIPIVYEKAKKKLGLVSPIRTNLSLCIIFSVFALLNLRLHRRVKLLVLASSTLEFRVLFTSCHAAAAPSSSLLPYTTIVIAATIYHISTAITLIRVHLYHRFATSLCSIALQISATSPSFHQIHLRHQS